MNVCIIFSRYARQPKDGKQHGLFELVSMIAGDVERVEVLGLARSAADLTGPVRWQHPNVRFDEMVFAGSYNVQCVAGLLAEAGVPIWPGTGSILRWIEARDRVDTTFFVEGFPLAFLLARIRRAHVVWGEVDSYLRRASRLGRFRKRSRIVSMMQVKAAYLVERHALKSADVVHVYSAGDAEFLRRVHRTDKIISIPIVQLNLLRSPLCGDANVRNCVLVWADSSYDYLERSMEEVLRVIGAKGARQNADFSFLIGKNVRLLNMIRALGWEAHERVSDIAEYLRPFCAVCLPDITGTGLKYRTITSMALGKCVIGTRAAWEGIPRSDATGVMLRQYSDLPTIVDALGRSGSAPLIGKAAQHLVNRIYGRDCVRLAWLRLLANRTSPPVTAVLKA
jgi:hypothetical protein